MNNKPFELRFKEIRDTLFSLVNNAHDAYQIPYYILEPVLDTILRQVQIGADAEYKNAQAVYDASQQDEAPADEDGEEIKEKDE